MKQIMILLLGLMPALAFAHEDDFELQHDEFQILGCVKATASQISVVDRGNRKKDRFLAECAKATNNSPWCAQMIRPNPESIDVFRCTYGSNQVHQLIHPDESTWKHAFKAVKLVDELEALGMDVCVIYNWWRPEPYNRNVGGAKGRHPYATSVDVRLCDKSTQQRAFNKLCEWRRQGRLRAVGYYPTSALHFGIADARGNTWGKSCP